MLTSRGPGTTVCPRALHLPRNLTSSTFLATSSLFFRSVLFFDSLATVLRSWLTSVSSKELASIRLIWRPDVRCCSFFFFCLSVCCSFSWVPAVVEVGSVVGGLEVEGFSGWLGGIIVGVVSF